MNKYNSKEKVEQSIYRVMEQLGINRMPSCSEIRSVEYSEDLINAMRKYNGGIFKTAEKLGLEVKRSSVQKGRKWEMYVKKLLEQKGHTVEKMTTKHPYDLLIDGLVKIDVKESEKHTYPNRSFITYGYNLRLKNSSCDIYILVKEDTEEVYIIPSCKVKVTQINLGQKSKYDIYKDRFDYIDKYREFYEGVM